MLSGEGARFTRGVGFRGDGGSGHGLAHVLQLRSGLGVEGFGVRVVWGLGFWSS